MVFMIVMGSLLRTFELVPVVFIACVYTGIGIALSLAGVIFFKKYIQTNKLSKQEL